jgi:hypothetical protein
MAKNVKKLRVGERLVWAVIVLLFLLHATMRSGGEAPRRRNVTDAVTVAAAASCPACPVCASSSPPPSDSLDPDDPNAADDGIVPQSVRLVDSVAKRNKNNVMTSNHAVGYVAAAFSFLRRRLFVSRQWHLTIVCLLDTHCTFTASAA